jgi:hypothetical protein
MAYLQHAGAVLVREAPSFFKRAATGRAIGWFHSAFAKEPFATAPYGTAIGAWYAELFPKRARAFVVDGALDLKLSALDILGSPL